MRGLHYILLAFWIAVISCQQLLPSNLPACAQQCTALQQGATGCLPAGGAPQSNQGTYQSCFCQSALLTQLYAPEKVQLCSSCQSADMTTIQNWYKNFCGKGGAALPGGNQNNQQSTSTTANSPSNTSNSKAKSTGNNSATSQEENGSWISTHYKWVIMLIVVILGLVAFAFAFVYFHRRYHRRRMSKWSSAPSSQPNINTWGPGQSVHDLGMTAGRDQEKGKTREHVSQVQQPQPARRGGGQRDREKPRRFSGKFF